MGWDLLVSGVIQAFWILSIGISEQKVYTEFMRLQRSIQYQKTGEKWGNGKTCMKLYFLCVKENRGYHGRSSECDDSGGNAASDAGKREPGAADT